MSDERPAVMLQPICNRHGAALMHALKLRESDPWLAHYVTAQILLFGMATADARIHKRAPELGDMSVVLAEIGCLACFLPGSMARVIRIFGRGGLDHAAKVAQGKATDPEYIFDKNAAGDLEAKPPDHAP